MRALVSIAIAAALIAVASLNGQSRINVEIDLARYGDDHARHISASVQLAGMILSLLIRWNQGQEMLR